MNDQHDDGYAFRHKLDGTDDAICLRCFRTVVALPEEPGIGRHAGEHHCDEGAVYERNAFTRL